MPIIGNAEYEFGKKLGELINDDVAAWDIREEPFYGATVTVETVQGEEYRISIQRKRDLPDE